jgi:hypothetical protein
MDLPDFGKKYGPLPLGAWIILAGAGIGFYLYKARGSYEIPDAEFATDPSEDVSIPPGVGEGPGYTYFPPPTTDAPRPENVRNNTQWAALAIQRTIANSNYAAPQVMQSITKYVGKQSLTDKQVEIVGRAVELIGPPPKPLQIIRAPHKPTGGGGGGQNPKPPAHPTPGDSKWYQIRKGDSLQEIARKFYANPGQRANDIFNANRKGKDRPGPTQGFMDGPGDLPVGRWLYIPGPTQRR